MRLGSHIWVVVKAVVQRVEKAHVVVNHKTVGKIGFGLLVFLGITHTDTKKECTWLAEKVSHLRIFQDADGKMNKSVQECKKEVLVVSQFTLYANASTGRRPDFVQAAPPERALGLYHEFIHCLEHVLGHSVQTGEFGAKMAVHLVNDGPVTLILER